LTFAGKSERIRLNKPYPVIFGQNFGRRKQVSVPKAVPETMSSSMGPSFSGPGVGVGTVRFELTPHRLKKLVFAEAVSVEFAAD
jgi:hypothetical protein